MFQKRKNIYVHQYSIADLTPTFRDASQNPPCSASPRDEIPKRSQRRKKVASMVNRLVPHGIFPFYNQLSIFCRKLTALFLSPLAVTHSVNQMHRRKTYIQNGPKWRERQHFRYNQLVLISRYHVTLKSAVLQVVSRFPHSPMVCSWSQQTW